MKKYRFRLEQVLKVRQIQQSQAEIALMQANRELTEAAVLAEQHLDRYSQTPGPSGALPASQFLIAIAHQRAVAESALNASNARHAAAEMVEAKRGEWEEAAARAEMLERLDERHRDEFAIERERDEGKEVDDIVVTRHGRH